MDIFMAETVAREYWRTNSWKHFEGARDLVNDIDRYMASKGLAKSTISRVDVAEHVLAIQRTQAAVAEADAAAFRNNVQGGTTADDAALQHMNELALAQQVAQMSVAEFGANRERFGLSKSVFAHLAGE
jgi:hypothetical protein